MASADLLPYITDGASDFLTAQMPEWLQSRRFRAFAEQHRDKLRKKRRGVRDAEALRDLAAEWEAAYRLAQEPHLTVRYEAYAAFEGRGPDFTVTFAARAFNLEVTRVRGPRGDTPPAATLLNTVCAKAAQMPPSAVNVLWLACADARVGPADLDGALALLEQRLQARDDGFFDARGFRGTGDFRAHHRRLSGILFRGEVRHSAAAKHPLPPEVSAVLRRLSA